MNMSKLKQKRNIDKFVNRMVVVDWWIRLVMKDGSISTCICRMSN